MVQMLQAQTHPISQHKVRAYTNIIGNEEADKLAKEWHEKENHKNARQPFEHGHTIFYYFHRNEWPSMDATPDKGLFDSPQSIFKNMTCTTT